jgi:hypothetical protein
MDTSLFRTRIAVLWVAVAVAVSTSLVLYLVTPGAVAELVAGEMEGEPLTDAVGFMFATLAGIPLLMAVLTLLSGARWSRITNLVVSALLALFVTFAVGSHLAAGDVNGHVAVAVVGWVLALLLVSDSVAWLRSPTPVAPAAPSRSHAGTAA